MRMKDYAEPENRNREHVDEDTTKVIGSIDSIIDRYIYKFCLSLID